MRDRRPVGYRPRLEPLEAKRLLNAGPAAPAAAGRNVAEHAPAQAPIHLRAAAEAAAEAGPRRVEAGAVRARPAALPKPNHGFLVFRVTNPNDFNNHFNPPFQQVMVQRRPPKPGHEYNILFLTVRNGTAQTFDASSGFKVRLSKQHTYTPILTGDMTWKPGERIVFYVLTKKYYPIDNQVSGGFWFILGGARSIAIPGPSGIFQRITYNPKTFSQTLGSIVVNGEGNQGGVGVKFGMPNTTINEFVSARTNRNDFGGYF